MITLSLLLCLAQAPPPPGAEAYRRGISLLEQKHALEALPELEEAARLDPDNPQYWKALGVAYATLRRLPDAAERFGRACALNRNFPDACYYLGRVLFSLGRFEDALAPLDSALKADAVKSRAETAIAECDEALGRAAEAEAHYHWALHRHDSAEQHVRLAYGRFLVRQERAANAVAILEAAQQPETAESRYELGVALALAGRLEDAAGAMERAVSLRPSSAEYRMPLARVYRRLGRLEDALREERAAAEMGTVERR